MADYLAYLNDLSHEERSIFLYSVVLKISLQDTARYLKMPKDKVCKICNILTEQKELLYLKSLIEESFL